MIAILLLLMETKSDDEFKIFVENLSTEQIENILFEAELIISEFPEDFDNKCADNDECCLFALLQAKLSAIAKNQETKFAILQAKLQKKFENNNKLQKALEELFNDLQNDLQIKFKEEAPENDDIDDGPGWS